MTASTNGDLTITPTFLSNFFRFDEGEEPYHVNQHPSVPSFVDGYVIYDQTNEGKTILMAVDAPDIAMAGLIARARQREVEATMERYGYSNDILILHPDGSTTRTYTGRWEDND